jgi:hypothetical protein
MIVYAFGWATIHTVFSSTVALVIMHAVPRSKVPAPAAVPALAPG